MTGHKEADIRRCLVEIRRYYSFKALLQILLKMQAEEKKGERFV